MTNFTLYENMFRDAVKKHQRENDLNGSEMAKLLGVSRQYYSGIKRGERSIGKKTAQRLMKVLGLTESEIFRPELQQIQQLPPVIAEAPVESERQILNSLLKIHDRLMDMEARLRRLEDQAKAHALAMVNGHVIAR
jgi:transcriptional regulator with XRE-family HTH domain